MAVSFQCMTKSTTNKKIKKIKIKKKKKNHYSLKKHKYQYAVMGSVVQIKILET